jgi:hypothetical protein
MILISKQQINEIVTNVERCDGMSFCLIEILSNFNLTKVQNYLFLTVQRFRSCFNQIDSIYDKESYQAHFF